jgi:hypothetical protein
MNTDDLGKEPSSSTDEPALKAVRSETQEMSSAQPHIITSKSITQGDLDPTHNGTHSGASNTKSSVSDDEAADDALDAPAAVDAPSVISSPQRAARSQSRREDRRRCESTVSNSNTKAEFGSLRCKFYMHYMPTEAS